MRLKELREAKGFSQGRLSRLSGVPRESINRFERGKRKPSIDTLEKLKKPLECTIDEIVSEG